MNQYAQPAPSVVPVSGFVRPPFEPLADVFARVVAAQGQGGAALAVYRDGRPVVDLVGGDYRTDSLQLVFSISKAITAVAAAMAHDDGLIDLDAPLADYWPAFRRPATAAVTGRMVLSHRSGLAAVDQKLTLEDLLAGRDEQAVERQEPYWEPGTRHGYHAFTFGTLLNGAFRRAVGRSVGEFVAERVAPKLGLDLWIGTPAEQLGRVERIRHEPTMLTPGRARFLAQSAIPAGSTGQLAQTMDLFNRVEVARSDWPSTSGVAGARDLAKLLYATLDTVDGVRLISAASRDRMRDSRSRGTDMVLGVDTHFGSGVQLAFPQLPFLGPRSYGHEAAGGSAAFADDEFGVAVGFTTNVFPSMAGAGAAFLTLLPTIRHCLTSV
ncbi:CubicO group peptidase, beta-lactamase class C family [Micromonospora pallida]|uniref:CubicO group peptidase, beta-lactamase class C family n=1 Tax=Micromonospora pallida TaxID=145854 RepID=A0A1C6SHQ1_9ACTN|nr:serine hydrolase domain-containing protein [Micromonospora pallida]SCL28962.1 CubicO group peptidase, beta-lactamase class C family [Micromonospora pallida]